MGQQPSSLEKMNEVVSVYRQSGYNLTYAAKSLKLPRSTLQGMLAQATRARLWDPDEVQRKTIKEGLEVALTDESGTIWSRSSQIKTLEQALRAAEVDLEKWQVASHVINKWDIGAKNEHGEIAVQALWQVKVWLKPRLRDDPKLLGAEVVKEIARLGTQRIKCRHERKNPHGLVLELSLPDLHIGKLAWRAETGDSYDSDKAVEVYNWTVADLMAKAAPYRISQIVMPIGNDLVHVDTSEGTTTAGTHVDADSRWRKMFAVARSMLIASINQIAHVAPIEVIVIPGNHDQQSSFALGEVLSAYYRSDKHIMIDNSPPERKYRRYGTNLIGWTHGDDIKQEDLPLVMANEAREDYASCAIRTWHLGHFHKARERKHTAGDTHGGVSVQVIPSLSGTDSWHYKKGFVGGLKAAEVFVWNPQTGVEARLYSHPPKDFYR